MGPESDPAAVAAAAGGPGDAKRTTVRGRFLNETIPALKRDPYSVYRAWHGDAPAQRLLPGLWVINGHGDATAGFKDWHRFSNDYRNSRGFRRKPVESKPGGLERIARAVGELDPPDHTRLRNLVSGSLTSQRVKEMVPMVRSLVDRLLEPIVERARAGEVVDLVDGLAFPLPVAVIGSLLGIPQADWEALRHWSEDILFAGDPFVPPEDMAKANAAADGMGDYFLALGDERRKRPGDDLVSILVRALDDGRMHSEEEFLSMCSVLLVAGHTTTLNLIANGILALMRHRSELQRLHDDPTLTRTAVEEFLRYDAPVHFMGRVALEDVEIDGQRIARGDRVYLGIAAANRDPRRFHEPDAIDIGRRNNRHLSFGAGIHVCVGAHLGRLEGQTAIGSLVARLPGLSLGDRAPLRNTQIAIPRLETLPLVLDGSPRGGSR
jgi:cytochrome P450